jgi:hypothetical protein
MVFVKAGELIAGFVCFSHTFNGIELIERQNARVKPHATERIANQGLVPPPAPMKLPSRKEFRRGCADWSYRTESVSMLNPARRRIGIPDNSLPKTSASFRNDSIGVTLQGCSAEQTASEPRDMGAERLQAANTADRARIPDTPLPSIFPRPAYRVPTGLAFREYSAYFV